MQSREEYKRRIGGTYGEFSILKKQENANNVKEVMEQIAADSDTRITLL